MAVSFTYRQVAKAAALRVSEGVANAANNVAEKAKLAGHKVKAGAQVAADAVRENFENPRVDNKVLASTVSDKAAQAFAAAGRGIAVANTALETAGDFVTTRDFTLPTYAEQRIFAKTDSFKDRAVKKIKNTLGTYHTEVINKTDKASRVASNAVYTASEGSLGKLLSLAGPVGRLVGQGISLTLATITRLAVLVLGNLAHVTTPVLAVAATATAVALSPIALAVLILKGDTIALAFKVSKLEKNLSNEKAAKVEAKNARKVFNDAAAKAEDRKAGFAAAVDKTDAELSKKTRHEDVAAAAAAKARAKAAPAPASSKVKTAAKVTGIATTLSAVGYGLVNYGPSLETVISEIARHAVVV